MILLRSGIVGLGLLVLLLVLGYPAQARPPNAPPAVVCPGFPADNVWNADITTLPLHPQSAAYMTTLGAGARLDPNFSAAYYQGAPNGVPFVVVPAGQAIIQVTPQAYRSESDFGPAPIPTNAPVQGGPNAGGDRHVIVVDSGCVVYEIYHAHPNANGSWWGDSTARWPLTSNALRPNGWTSADAAGLPVYVGLVKFAEVQAGSIPHALRFTANQTHIRTTWVWPARHSDGTGSSPNTPPMGTRLRLSASINPNAYPAQATVIIRALQTYGMFLADSDPGNPDFGFGGEPNAGWSDSALNTLRGLRGSDFAVVDDALLMGDPNSGAVRGAGTPPPTGTPTGTPTRAATATVTPTAHPTQSLHPLLCWPYPACRAP